MNGAGGGDGARLISSIRFCVPSSPRQHGNGGGASARIAAHPTLLLPTLAVCKGAFGLPDSIFEQGTWDDEPNRVRCAVGRQHAQDALSRVFWLLIDTIAARSLYQSAACGLPAACHTPNMVMYRVVEAAYGRD
jgi:hypothetical protein